MTWPIGRRLDGAPRPVPGEILRTPLVDRLARRWDVAVTTVVAGAGFGKSTALSQATRAHAAEPRGVEAWVTCEPGDEDARRLSEAICRAFGVGVRAVGPVESVLEALRACSPIESCLILDDLHELPAGSSGLRLVAGLVGRLPAGGHVVLSGRGRPAVPLARLRAAGEVHDVTEDDLAFGAADLARVADGAGRPVAAVSGLGGWPALVRLTLAAPPGVARDFLWEEVLCGLTGPERDVLLCLAVLGSADAATLAELAGGPVDLESLTGRVPLVARFGDGEARAHPLWTGALARLLPAGRVARVRARAGELLLARGDALRAGTVALAAADPGLLDRAATALVAATLATFPQDTGARWLGAAPAAALGRPGLLLLAAATRYAGRADDPGLTDMLDAAAASARAAGDVPAETAALSLATIAAHAHGDESRLGELFQRAVELPGADGHATLRLLAGGVRGALFDLFGSVDDALATVESLDPADVAGQPGRIVARFHVYLLILAGRADEAAVLAERYLADSPYDHVRRMPRFARWMAGQPGGLLSDAGRDPDEPPFLPAADANDRYRFHFLAFAVVVCASLGDRTAVRHVYGLLSAAGLGADTRDAAMVAVAAAADAIVHGDEPAARRTIEHFLDRHPLSDPVASLHLRRFLAYGYVLSPAARGQWDAAELGPAHERARAAARLLVTARAGRLTTTGAVTPDTVLTAFPLRWSVELAVRCEAARLPYGRLLMRRLTELAGRAAHHELRGLGVEPAAAGRLLAAVPAVPESRIRIEVLGPLRVLRDDVPVHPPELRRRRVRQLLAVLAVHGEIDRAALAGLLWPDLAAAAAARNLRVTLTYVRRVLEPDGDGTRLATGRDRIRLVRSPALTADVADLRDHLDAAAQARARGEPATACAHLADAVALWRGEPLTAADHLPALAAAAAAIRRDLTGAALTVGERRLAEGEAGVARELARRVLAAEPYDERAMRLLLAAETLRRDPVGMDGAIRRVRDTLASLRAVPQPATAVVLRQAYLVAGRTNGRPAGAAHRAAG